MAKVGKLMFYIVRYREKNYNLIEAGTTNNPIETRREKPSILINDNLKKFTSASSVFESASIKSGERNVSICQKAISQSFEKETNGTYSN